MRVLMTADTVGGVWTYALELASALGPLDVEVVLATMGEPVSRAQAKQAAEVENLTLVESRYALEWMPEPWRDVDAAAEWLLGLAHDVDVVHLNGYAHAALPFRAPVISVAHSCVLTWFRAVRGCEAPREWDEYRRRVAAGLAAADAIVAPTEAILRAILDAHGITSPGRVIANGRWAGDWRPGAKEPFVLAAGRMWDEAKGLPELAAAAPEISWPIRVAGPTCGPVGNDRSVRGVHQLGQLPPRTLAAWAARASIYALPARYEPFGLSIVEAALAGCALVVGDIPTLREIWADTAVYVQPGDPAALAAELQALIDDPARRRMLAAASRDRALALTPARMAQAYRALYDELCEGAQEECA
jgi:glycosyltransferase involved in cell wall biosynthesis